MRANALQLGTAVLTLILKWLPKMELRATLIFPAVLLLHQLMERHYACMLKLLRAHRLNTVQPSVEIELTPCQLLAPSPT